jgi:mRNA-degrading endonuclease toxin of MazEF toxin-antitoxin module
MNINIGEVWFVHFPLEEDSTQFLPRPVVVLDVETLEVLSVKVTKTEPRNYDEYDTPIVYWQEAKLRFKSTARVAKTIYLPKSMFQHKIGDLHPDDLSEIQTIFQRFIENIE